MKLYIALCAILAVSEARVVINANVPTGLLGEEECTWGPSYWCENIKTAAGCNATKHCIKTIWNDMKVPEDNDSVCNVCKDMVQQARDQLESNQTQQDLKAVFEGSCKLIHIKPIVHECVTIVDQFIPELVETLASQMNPSVVCSVAGLCNSARIDKLLEEYEQTRPKIGELKTHSLEKDELEPDECSKCYTIAAHIEQKISNTPRDKMLQQMLRICGDLSSFSDACSATVITHFDAIYNHLQENFNAANICHLSGQCSAKFHKHDDTDTTLKVEIRPLSSVGMVDVGDDLPCKLCEQLVEHLKDLLVANTTETEFRVVLEGLCKQTKSFSTECTAIVDEYYPQIYDYLTKQLNTNAVCQMSGICPAPDKMIENAPIWPLVPKDVAKIGVRIIEESKKDLEINEKNMRPISEAEAMQLPYQRLMPFPLSEVAPGVTGKESCALCEYVLHYLQDTITDPSTENKVKEALGKVCMKLPGSVKNQCTEFVDTYGDAIIAILAQEIDPSQVCPMLRLCPSAKMIEFWGEIPSKYMLEEKMDKPSCPLCLLAVSQVYNVIKNNKTEANIEIELNKLCTHLPQSLSEECKDFVKGYSKELIELLLADLTPQEVCVYIKLCDASRNVGPSSEFVTDKNGEILTNEIPDASIAVSPVKIGTPLCVVCEYAMHYVDKEIGGEAGRHKVENAVRRVCKYLPKTIGHECNEFINKYGDGIIKVITEDISPKEACTFIGFCFLGVEELKASVTECALCKSTITMIDQLLDDPAIDEHVEKAVSKVCDHVPPIYHDKCTSMINIYGQSIINLIKRRENMSKICGFIGLCAPDDYMTLSLENSRIKRSYEKIGVKMCTWGPAYWCSTNETARECKAVDHCREKVWKADSAPPKQIA